MVSSCVHPPIGFVRVTRIRREPLLAVKVVQGIEVPAAFAKKGAKAAAV